VTRINAQQIRLRSSVFYLTQLAIVRWSNRSFFERNEVRLSCMLAPTPVMVNADANRCAQMVGEILLHNAAKFTSRGGRANYFGRGRAGQG